MFWARQTSELRLSIAHVCKRLAVAVVGRQVIDELPLRWTIRELCKTCYDRVADGPP